MNKMTILPCGVNSSFPIFSFKNRSSVEETSLFRLLPVEKLLIFAVDISVTVILLVYLRCNGLGKSSKLTVY